MHSPAMHIFRLALLRTLLASLAAPANLPCAGGDGGDGPECVDDESGCDSCDVIDILSGCFDYTRLADSDLVSQMTRPNGIATAWSYEPHRDLITQVQNGTASTYGYVNDAIGRRTSMSRAGSAYPASDVISYTYNDRSELTGAQSNVDSTYNYSYAYDPIGNRTAASEAGLPWTYTANSLNQYTSATENGTRLSFAYDLDGSMTYRPVDASTGWTQVWNGENRMVETYKGSDRLTFRYDYMGRRVEKCVYSDNALASRTLFVYDGFKCVQELDGTNNNAVLRTHFWQPPECGLDVILATTDDSGTACFLHDANKNVMQETDDAGALLGNFQYAPFGQCAVLDGQPPAFGFSSEMADRETALNYYIYRYWDNLNGIWLRKDPIGEKAGINLYNYCQNNPINFFDSNGREIPALDSVSANPSISLDLYYDMLGETFNMSRTQIMQRASKCLMLYNAYKLNCSGCKNPCISKAEAQANTACLSLEVAGRAAYLSLNCDYFLTGSIRKGTAIALQRHAEQLAEKSAALAKCASKAQ